MTRKVFTVYDEWVTAAKDAGLTGPIRQQGVRMWHFVGAGNEALAVWADDAGFLDSVEPSVEPAEHTASWLPHMKGLQEAADAVVHPEKYDDTHGT